MTSGRRPQDERAAATHDDRVAACGGLLDDRAREARQPLVHGRGRQHVRGERRDGGIGRPGGEGRGDALPETRQPLVVALGLRLGDAGPLRDRGHDLPVQQLRVEPLGQRRRPPGRPPRTGGRS